VACSSQKAIGPLFGGVLTSVWNWRAIFWFLAIFAGLIFTLFTIFFRDTFRRERSLTYQNILKQRLRSAALPPHSYPNKSSRLRWGGLQDKSDAELEETTAKAGVEDTARECGTDSQVAITLSITDVNPLKPLLPVLRRTNNFFILLSSGLYRFIQVR